MNKRKRYYTRTIDLCFLLILLLTAIYAGYNVWKTDMIPETWLIFAGALLGVLWLILFFISLKKCSKAAIYMKRIFIVILAGALTFAGYSSSNFMSTLNQMNTPTEEEEEVILKETIHLVTLANSQYDSLNDFSNTYIGVQNGTDKDNSFYGKQQLEKESKLMNPVYIEDMDYNTLHQKLLFGTIQSYIISDTKLKMMSSTTEGYEDSIKIITSYERVLPKPPVSSKDISKEPFTVLLSGLDEPGSPDQKLRSDVNIILFVNPLANHISMVSLSRDSYMPNSATNWMNDKLTHTGIYGVNETIKTVENFFGFDIDYYARVSFTSLIEIVNTIGGIDVDVEIDFCEQNENREFGDKEICLSAGQQEINGQEALAYARHRHTAGYDNPGRERAQQRIIKAIIDKVVSVNGIASINSLLKIAPNYVVTDIPPYQISSFVKGELNNLKPWSISSVSIGSGNYDAYLPVASLTVPQNVYVLSKEDAQKVLNAYSACMDGIEMNKFEFDLNDLSNSSIPVNDDPNIVWDYMVDSGY